MQEMALWTEVTEVCAAWSWRLGAAPKVVERLAPGEEQRGC